MSGARWLRFKAGAGRLLLAVLAIAAVAAVVGYRRMTGGDVEPQPPPIPANDRSAEMVTRDFKHVETRMDRTIWILESAMAEISEEKARLSTVKITWYGEPGMIPVVITSQEGEVNLKSRNVALSGTVRVERADGSHLLTEELWWDQENSLLRAPKHVVISTPDFTFSGEALDVNVTTQKCTLFGPLQGEIQAGSLSPAHPS